MTAQPSPLADPTDLAARLRAVPDQVAAALDGVDDRTLRHRPAPGEWSAIEVTGHLIDKMNQWRVRVVAIAEEDRPTLVSYDQDEGVRIGAYQQAEPADLLVRLTGVCDGFATEVERLPITAFDRRGIHPEYDHDLTLLACVTIPLDSVQEHLEQIRAALASAG